MCKIAKMYISISLFSLNSHFVNIYTNVNKMNIKQKLRIQKNFITHVLKTKMNKFTKTERDCRYFQILFPHCSYKYNYAKIGKTKSNSKGEGKIVFN